MPFKPLPNRRLYNANENSLKQHIYLQKQIDLHLSRQWKWNSFIRVANDERSAIKKS